MMPDDSQSFDRKKAKDICDGYFAVVDSIVEHYMYQGSKMFPDAIAEIDRLEAENKDQLETCMICDKENSDRFIELQKEIVAKDDLKTDC